MASVQIIPAPDWYWVKGEEEELVVRPLAAWRTVEDGTFAMRVVGLVVQEASEGEGLDSVARLHVVPGGGHYLQRAELTAAHLAALKASRIPVEA